MNKFRSQLRVLASALALALGAAHAATVTWDGDDSGGDQNWTQPDSISWTGDTYTDDDNAQFLGAGIGTVTVDGGGVTPEGITVNSSSAYIIAGGSIGGTGTLNKAGSGTLTLSGANTFSGGTIIDGGIIDITADNNLGAADTPITFTSSATLKNNNGAGNITVDLGSRPIAVSSGAIATLYVGRGDVITTDGAVTGDGGVAIQVNGGASPKVYLLSTANTFKGPLDVRSGSDNPSIYLNSLSDDSGAITLYSSSAHFYYHSGAITPLTLNTRPIVVSGGGHLENSSSYPLTINSSITTSGGGTQTLNLDGGSGGAVTCDIDEGTAILNLTVAGSSGSTWSLSGNNTITGTLTISDRTTLHILGTPAMVSSKVVMNRGSTLQLLTDTAGSVNLGNELEFNRTDTAQNQIQVYTVDVGNNGGGTLNSTIIFGKVDFTQYDMRPSRQLNTTGANGYSVQVGNVDLATELQGTATGGSQRFRGVTAPLEITGTVKQIDGNTGTYPNSNILYLGGTGVGNLVSGVIADATDGNEAQELYKGETGEWTLSGVNTYTGSTTINDGDLLVSGSTAAGAVSVTGTGKLGGTGTVGGVVTIDSTGGINLLDGAVGTLTLSDDLDIDGAVGANDLFFDLGTAANGTDKIVVSGWVDMAIGGGAGVIHLNQLTGTKINAGTYNLIESAKMSCPLSDFTLATTASFGNTYSLQFDAGDDILQLVVVAASSGPATAYWEGSTDINWSTAANWDSDESGGTPASGIPNYDSDVYFHATGATRLTTDDVDTDFDIDSLTYTAGATANTTIPGSKTLIFENGNGLTANTPSSGTPTHTISAPVAIAADNTWTVNSSALVTMTDVISDFGAGRSFTKAGAGTLTLNGDNTYTGPTIITGGTLAIYQPSLEDATDADPLGMSSPDPENLLLGPGTTLRFDLVQDNVQSTDRGFTINGTSPGDSATLDSSRPSGTAYRGVQLKGTASPAYGTANQTRTLILGGTQASSGGNLNNNNRIYAQIADNGTGAVSLQKDGVGSWQVRGVSTYTGGTTINGGALRLAVANIMPTLGAVTVADVSGAVFDLSDLDQSGYSQTIGSLTGGGSSGGAVKLGTGTLTVGDVNNTAFAGVISGTGGLIKQGDGTLTLSGINTYSGTTLINAGTIKGDVAGSLASSAVTVTNTPGVESTLEISISDNSMQWTCASLTFITNGLGSQMSFDFVDVPHATTAPLNITGTLTFTGVPLVIVAVTAPDAMYPLLTVGGTAPSDVPALSMFDSPLSSLSWGGAGNKTLYLDLVNKQVGTVFSFK